jgi:hypothetical protein
MRPSNGRGQGRRVEGRSLAALPHLGSQDRGFKLDSFKWLKEDLVEDADDLPEPAELATDAIAVVERAAEELTAVLTLPENGGPL